MNAAVDICRIVITHIGKLFSSSDTNNEVVWAFMKFKICLYF